MKGIIILTFNESLETSIDKQYPSNLAEFLKISPELLKNLSDHHMKRKMEPNFIHIMLEDEINVASFYSGFSFRHYVGTPNFAISIFLSEDDDISTDFEGMMRRIAHELLPKRDALNFDDILGKYYEMLKAEELTPYWEEIIEGESNVVERKTETLPDDKMTIKVDNEEEEEEKEEGETISPEVTSLTDKNEELQRLLDEKTKKIRDLTRKFTDLNSEKNETDKELDTLKDELSEQYIKLEKWNVQLAELNEHNAKLMVEVKDLNELVTNKENEISDKDQQIDGLKRELSNVKVYEKKSESLQQEIEKLKSINTKMNSELQVFENQVKELSTQLQASRNSSSQNLDTITNLKIELKDLKNDFNSLEREKEQLTSQIFDLKKELKVMRREKDHYLKLVKDNDLL